MTLIRERFRGYSDRESVHETPPNHAVEPTASSFGFAYASGGGSPPALIKALRFATRLDQRPGLRPVVIEALRASITTGWSCVLA
jgi:hypothetical protein